MSSYKQHASRICVFSLLSGLVLAGCARQAKVQEPDEVVARNTLIEAAPAPSPYFDPKIHYIFFAKNEARFSDAYANELVIVFDELKKHKNSCIEIYGYDSIEKDYHSSKKLADTRAEWTRRCLVGEGVDPQFIKIVRGMEPVKLPKKPPHDALKQARRVEVHVVPCDDADYKLRNKPAEIDKDNPFKYK